MEGGQPLHATSWRLTAGTQGREARCSLGSHPGSQLSSLTNASMRPASIGRLALGDKEVGRSVQPVTTTGPQSAWVAKSPFLMVQIPASQQVYKNGASNECSELMHP
jgi:hypothetical protein